MRNRYFVCYDVHDPQRLTRTYKKMCGYGEPIQYSVFVCDLNDKERVIMKEDLKDLLNLEEDRILMISVGRVEKSKKYVSVMGMSLDTQKESSIVI